MTNSKKALKRESLDETVTTSLAKAYGNLSRRSFLSSLTRKLLGLAGVVAAAELLPYAAREATADELCGLHGWLCVNGTTCNGGAKGIAWLQCCDIPYTCGGSYVSCCRYTDYCGVQPNGYGSDCFGEPPSGPSWCGGAGGPDALYICTEISCTGVYTEYTTCNAQCNESVSGFTLLKYDAYPHN